MEFNGGAEGGAFAAIRGEVGVDCCEGRVRFHSELADEAAREKVPVLVRLLGTVPDVPLVRVTDGHAAAVGTFGVAVRAAWVVEGAR